MGIVKISDDLHEDIRITCKAMSRSINAQAEHWMIIGKLIEANPELRYSDAIKLLLDEARSQEKAQPATEEREPSGPVQVLRQG